MPGVFWYIALAAISIGIAIFIFIKKGEAAKLIAFYLFATMVSYLGEVLVMVLFDSYAYKPGVFSENFKENIMGHMILNMTVWPTIAILVASFSLRFRWLIVISVIYMLLDVLFTSLEIYHHNWWRTWMTGIIALLFCNIMKDWYLKQEEYRYRVLRYVMFSMILWFIIFEPGALLLLAEKQINSVGFFENIYRDSVTFAFIYTAGLSFISAYFICILKKWYWKLVPFFVCAIGDIILMQTGNLLFYGGWNIYYLLLTRTICLLLFIALEKRYSYKPAVGFKNRT